MFLANSSALVVDAFCTNGYYGKYLSSVCLFTDPRAILCFREQERFFSEFLSRVKYSTQFIYKRLDI